MTPGRLLRAVSLSLLSVPALARADGTAPAKAKMKVAVEVLTAPCELFALDADGRRVDPRTSHASLSRTLPGPLASDMDGAQDRDALSWALACPPGTLPATLHVESWRPSGEKLDAIAALAVLPTPCPPGTEAGLECGRTPPIRATVDAVDRNHPSGVDRSLRAEVGGRLALGTLGRAAASIRVGGPRETAVGPLTRYRARLRFHVVRAWPGGQSPLGGDDAGARGVARAEARSASMLWGQCGIHFGPEAELDVNVVDPPPRHLVAIGCDLGTPASGGAVSFAADGKRVTVDTSPGDSPILVAHAVARAAERAGLSAAVSPNARIVPGALRSADVLVRRRGGGFASLAPLAERPLSSDRTLAVCLGEVNLSDGLSHFDDLDASAGTLEERTLIKAYEDGDPSTVDVFVVPSFSKTGRIGESFIDEAGAAIQNVIILDRAGIRAGSRSYALAHELGHVLLDLPGHPDDFGVDRPWALMDADAADATIFGPRRLSVPDCERALRQSGPGASLPLLSAWPFEEASGVARKKRR